MIPVGGRGVAARALRLGRDRRRRGGRQRLTKENVRAPTWYLGSGKAEELKAIKAATGFTLLVADDELSPRQQRTLETLLDVKVLDRSGVILDIFAQRAQTHEGRIQVELAQLEYQLPRLTRLWTPPVAHRGRHRHARSGRDPVGDRPAGDQAAYQEDPGTSGGGQAAAGRQPPGRGTTSSPHCRHRRVHERRQIDPS